MTVELLRAHRAEEWSNWQALARDYAGCGCPVCTRAYKRAGSNYPDPLALCSVGRLGHPDTLAHEIHGSWSEGQPSAGLGPEAAPRRHDRGFA